MAAQIRQFGLWDSPLQPGDLAQGKGFKEVAWDSDGRSLVWLENRGPDGVLVCQRGEDAPRDLTPPLSVRAQVGYGGGDFAVDRGRLFFAEKESGRLFYQPLDAGSARPLTPPFGHAAAPTVSPDGRLLTYVHTGEGVDCLAVVDSQGHHWPQRLVSRADFYMQPTWHPGGRQLAWIEWDHPQMPWDGTRLLLGQLRLSKNGLPQLVSTELLAGDTGTALFQPAFAPGGRALAYVSDQSGWSRLWLRDLQTGETTCLTEEEVDIGTPAWVQGLRVFSFSGDGRRIFFTRSEGGFRRAYQIDLASGQTDPIAALAEYTFVEQLAAAPRGNRLACIASASGLSPRIVSLEAGKPRVRARSSRESIPIAELATPESISWPSESGMRIHGLYYPPTSSHFAGRGSPPLIVSIHGGPTSQTDAGFNPRNQFFATRGYAVLDLNYRGSTGFGRQYMEALRGNWGISDVEDAIGGARFLANRGQVDPDRLVIMGGSAGGYTVLRALTVEPGFFKAGICLYGISNLFTLATDTHKFEARYLDSLLGPLPEASEIYRDRSPIFASERLLDPVAIFQGADDRVVPVEQAESIVASLRSRNVPHEYHLYEGEGHGWRKPETIASFYRAVEAFLKQHVLFA